MGDQVNELRASLRALLQPIARLARLGGVSCPELEEDFRIAYVMDVQKSPAKGMDPENVSAIDAETAIGRTGVRRILEFIRRDEGSLPAAGHRGQRVLSAWCHDPRFCDKYGNPRILQISQGRCSFAELCRLHAGESHPMILRLVEEAGAVRVLPGDRVELLREEFAKIDLSEAGLRAAVDQLKEHFETIIHNLTHLDKRDQLVCKHVVNTHVNPDYAPRVIADLTDSINTHVTGYQELLGSPRHATPPGANADGAKHLSVIVLMAVKPSAEISVDKPRVTIPAKRKRKGLRGATGNMKRRK